MNKILLIAFVATLVAVASAKPPFRPRPRPPVRPDQHRYYLIQRASALEHVANEIITFLKSQHKDVEAAAIARDQAAIKQLAQELASHIHTHDTHYNQVEAQLNALENQLDKEIKDVHYIPPHTGTDVHMRQLMDRAALLEKQAAELIVMLKSEHRDAEVAQLENEEKVVQTLAHQLSVSPNSFQIRVIERQLSVAEEKLSAAIKKAQLHNPDQEKRQKLLQKATALQTEVEQAIKYLRQNKREAEAIIFEVEETVLKQLVQKVSHPDASIHLEQMILDAMEARLDKELDKIHTEIEAKDPVRIQLLARADELIYKVNEAIKKLKAENHPVEAEILEKDQGLVKDLARKLKAARGAALITLERELTYAEARLALELRGSK